MKDNKERSANMNFDIEFDNFLKIKTTGRDDSFHDFINFPYEATPYSVLQTLANSGYIKKRDKIIDFGCGKGRVDFYLAYALKANMIGVELNERLFRKALDNKGSAISGNRVEFVNICASKYVVSNDVVGAYFFNPFSVDVLKEVIANFRNSKMENNRTVTLFFYYPSKDYIKYLAQEEDLYFCERLDCQEQFKDFDERECILIYKMH